MFCFFQDKMKLFYYVHVVILVAYLQIVTFAADEL